MVHSFAVYLPASAPTEDSNAPFSVPADVVEHGGLRNGCRVFVSGAADKRLVSFFSSTDGFAVSLGEAYSGVQLAEQLLLAGNKDSLQDWVSTTAGQYCAVVVSDKLPGPIAITDPSGLRSLFCLRLSTGLLLGSNVAILRMPAGR